MVVLCASCGGELRSIPDDNHTAYHYGAEASWHEECTQDWAYVVALDWDVEELPDVQRCLYAVADRDERRVIATDEWWREYRWERGSREYRA